MKIQFIVPPVSLAERYGSLKDAGTCYPSLGLAYIAAGAQLEGCDVQVIDSEALGYDYEAIETKIKEFCPDLIGMQVFFSNLERSFEVAKLAKSFNPNIQILLGGAEATVSPDAAISNPNIDMVIMGEGDIAIRELISALKGGTDFSAIKGLIYKKNSTIIKNPPREILKDLDSLPLPARALFPMHLYHSSANLRGKRTLNIMTSRGCPFRCAYCAGHRIFGKTYRYHSAEYVIREIKLLKEQYHVDSLQFYDETFTLHKNRVIELCEKIVAEKLNIEWACFTRVNLVDDHLLQIMKQAGCYQIFYGIESGVPRLLELIQKDITLEQARKAVKATKVAGIEACCSFMLALPSETEAESKQTIDFALELDPDYAQFPITTPYPNTRLYELALENGTIIGKKGTEFTSWDQIAYLPAGRSEHEIRNTLRLAYRKFYLRPSYILKRINQIRKLPIHKSYALVKSGIKTFILK